MISNKGMLKYWLKDYFHVMKWQGHTLLFRRPPRHYLGHIVQGLAPVILIPGIYEQWQLLKTIAEPISLKGHPVYVLENFGYNTASVPVAAIEIRRFINAKKLKDVVIVAHSKGGLIGKYLLAYLNGDNYISKLIAIATPFGGTNLAKLIPLPAIKELSPESDMITKLQKEEVVNHRIVSIFGLFDNHIWPVASCVLRGAKNMHVNTHGHHAILANPKVVAAVLREME